MAKKGQKFKKYDLALKEQILNEYKAGKTRSYLSQKYGVPDGTIASWQQIEKRRGGLNVVKRRHTRMKNLDYKERYEILKKYLAFLEQEAAKKK